MKHDMIQTEKLIFEYEKRDEEGNVIGTSRAIDEVDLGIEEGQFIAILGHNGSGKSTLAKHMNAILVPTGGTMWVATAGIRKIPRSCGMCARVRAWCSRTRTTRSSAP